jgi:hypothetical protein
MPVIHADEDQAHNFSARFKGFFGTVGEVLRHSFGEGRNVN